MGLLIGTWLVCLVVLAPLTAVFVLGTLIPVEVRNARISRDIDRWVESDCDPDLITW